MKRFQLLSLALVMSASTAFAQVQVDRPINLNNLTPANARVMGIKQVSDPLDAVSAEVLQKGVLIHASVSGGPNAYTLTFSPAISTPYSQGMLISFEATADNTTAVTLNGIALRKDVSTALAAGDIKNGQLVTAAYDGSNFQLISRTTDPTLSGLGGVPTSRTLTINGTAQDLSANRTWSVGTVTSITATAPLTGGTINGSGNIGIGASSTSTDGYLSAANFTNFNTAYTNRINSLTTTGSSGAATLVSNVLNIPNYTLTGLGGVPTTRTITINGTALDLSANRSWSVGTVTGSGTQNFVPKWNNAGGTALGNSLIWDNGTNVGIGNTSTTSRLEISTAALGSTSGDAVEMLRLSGSNGNGSTLDVRHIRTAAGSDWLSAATRIQQKIDATWQGYMQFNGSGNDYGISFGTGGTTTAPGNVPERLKIASNGTVTINNLAGTGTRVVYADNNGLLKTATTTTADWRMVIREDFESGSTSNWVAHTTTTGSVAGTATVQQCTAGGTNGGNYIYTNYNGTLDIILKGTYDLSAHPHTEVMVRFTLYYIDSWDGEWAWAGISSSNTTLPENIFMDSWDVDCCGLPWTNSGGTNNRGGARNLIGSTFSDRQVTVTGQAKYSANTFCLMVMADLDEGTTNEAYGVDNIEIYVR